MEVVVVVAVEDIPLKNEAASPRQMGHVRLDCKDVSQISFWSKTNLRILDTYLQPLVDTLGMEFVATGKDSKCLSDLKIAHADDASGLIVLRTVTSISEKNNPDLYHVLIQFQEELENRFSKKKKNLQTKGTQDLPVCGEHFDIRFG